MNVAEAVQACLDHPGLHAVVVTRTYRETAIVALPKLREAAPEGTEWRYPKQQLRFPNGSALSLGYAADPQDAMRFGGTYFQLALVDYSVDPHAVEFLRTRVRSPQGGPPVLGLHPLTEV